MYKYESARSCAGVFASLFEEKYGSFLDDRTVSPLPTISKHIRERGFDHMRYLTKKITHVCGGRYCEALERVNSTVQVGADEERRRMQVASAYRAVRTLSAKGKYVLIDDVWTTGSSMMAACAELQKVGINNISVVILAKSG